LQDIQPTHVGGEIRPIKDDDSHCDKDFLIRAAESVITTRIWSHAIWLAQ
jgi:hypothetical protein